MRTLKQSRHGQVLGHYDKWYDQNLVQQKTQNRTQQTLKMDYCLGVFVYRIMHRNVLSRILGIIGSLNIS